MIDEKQVRSGLVPTKVEVTTFITNAWLRNKHD